MKELWIQIAGEWSKEKDKVTTGIESGFVTFYTEESSLLEKIKELASLRTVFKGELDMDGKADILVTSEANKSESCFEIDITEKEDEKKAVSKVKKVDYLLISTGKDIIPLENVISEAQGICKVIVKIKDIKDAKTVLEALEVGADGILYKPDSADEVKNLVRVIEEFGQKKIELKKAKITKIKPTAMGTRVCIDTCSMMEVGEGALVGSQSNALFLVHSESVENPYVETRPFRINASAVHAYVLLPNGRTKYLSELKSGDEVLIVNRNGATRVGIVGRLKVEERPLLLVEAVCDGKKISTLLQNAETIRLVSGSGEPTSVAQLKVGDTILVHMMEGGRHFGKKIEETIVEK